MKNKNVILAAILSVCCLVIAFFSTAETKKVKSTLNEERYTRLEAEDKLNKALTDVKSLETELKNSKAKAESIQTILEQEKTATSNLKDELDKLVHLNKQLEGQVNQLVTSANSPAIPEPEQIPLPANGP